MWGKTGFTGRYRLGPESSPIRIVMLTDYQCVDCQRVEGEIEEIVGVYQVRRPSGQDDREHMKKIRDELGGRFCHRCEYCLPCEQGVQIPKVLLIKSQVRRFSPQQLSVIAKEAVASAGQCVECGDCVEKCPYHLPVPEMLKENAEVFGKFMADHGLTP